MRIIKTLLGTFVGLFILGISYIYISNTYVFPWEKEEAIQFALTIGGLNALPDNIKNLEIEKKGSFFTRQFIIDFEFKNSTQLKNWIQTSKRLKNNTPNIKGNTKVYEIYPGEENSYGGKVKIQDKKVQINMSSS